MKKLLVVTGVIICHFSQAQQTPFQARKAPFFLTVQIGGGAGTVAIGGGVQLVRQRVEPELLVGYVPSRFSGQPLTIFTFKTTYLPVNYAFGKHWRTSIGVGAYLTYTTGATIRDSKDPTTYQRGYYWFSTKIRTGLFLTPRLANYDIRQTSGFPPLAAYAELGTNDLYLLSRLPNKGAPSFTELLTLGFGSKARW
ncbi:hypothetical protein F1C16_21515 (plasmid) [Hymenobacter sp. NBH84]|uniref:hypothetical protein n=1 Tax=Hymenobacter sp. NBH84 TaxID=2596915 RepID=UPI001628C9E0|nr:hypothetical protein [Hymenobacter sp. NBH84]QNE42208.1 hypothetical protein F1C16_21515 [Hymenobacter sp. NBH84]